MRLFVLRLIVSAAWIAGVVFLAITTPTHHHLVRGVAATFVAIPGLISLLASIAGLSGRPLGSRHKRIKSVLQSGLITIHRKKLYGDDITKLSFHVWVIPRIYRIFLPHWFRRQVLLDSSRIPKRLRPTLKREAMFRFEHQDPSRVKFRKGIGVIGRCIVENNRDDPKIATLDRAQFRNALRRGAKDWETTPQDITFDLSFRDATYLAENYGQVAALVIREHSGEAIGCITLDLPPASGVRLVDQRGRLTREAHALLESLKAVRSETRLILVGPDKER